MLLLNACSQGRAPARPPANNSTTQQTQNLQTNQAIEINNQATKIAENSATLEAQSALIQEQLEVINLEATITHQSNIISEQQVFSIQQASRIKQLEEPNWLAIGLSLILAPSIGGLAIFSLSRLRRNNEQKPSSTQISSSTSSVSRDVSFQQQRTSENQQLNDARQGIVDEIAERSSRSQIRRYQPPSEKRKPTVSDRSKKQQSKSVATDNIRSKIARPNGFSQKTGHQNGPKANQPKVASLDLDFEKIETLKHESMNIRERLADQLAENGQQAEFSEPVSEQITPAISSKIDGEVTNLSQIYHMKPEFSKVISAVCTSTWSAPTTQLESLVEGHFLNVVIDDINALAIDLFGDQLLYEESGKITVTDEFRDELSEIVNA